MDSQGHIIYKVKKPTDWSDGTGNRNRFAVKASFVPDTYFSKDRSRQTVPDVGKCLKKSGLPQTTENAQKRRDELSSGDN